LDCDTIFARTDWAEHACALLERLPLVQLFSRIHDLPADAAPGELTRAELTGYSLAFVEACGTYPTGFGAAGPARGKSSGASGFAWAARRDVLEKYSLYDAAVLGGGDRALACAAVGKADAVIQAWSMNARQREHYLDWALPFFET